MYPMPHDRRRSSTRIGTLRRSLPWLASMVTLTLGLGGCVLRTGPEPSEFPLAQSPRGIMLEVVTAEARSLSELIDVREDGLIVLELNRNGAALDRAGLSHLTWERIRDVEPVPDFSLDWRSGRRPEDAELARLRRVSRYPPGLTDGQLNELLVYYGQDGLETAASSSGHHGEVPERTPSAEDVAFLEAVRGAAGSFADEDRAMISGYRPIGPDFPGMGRHWVNTVLLMEGRMDPARPHLLTYLDTPEGPVFTGVAFGRIVRPSQPPAPAPFAEAWHDHSGTVDEENLALNLAVGMSEASEEVRLSMLHFWVGVENPDGVLAQNNWALPFVREGIAVPEGPTEAAGKALFLASGGDAYYVELMEALTPLPADDRRAVETILSDARAHALPYAKLRDVERLSRLWEETWADIESGVSPATWAEVRLLGP